MQNYTGIKIIRAEAAWRMEDGSIVSKDVMVPASAPKMDGYEVVCDDGSKSWISKVVFEKTFRLTDAHPGGMTEQDFASLVRRTVAQYANEHLDKTDGKQISEEDVYIVWMVKVLQNNKALASTTLFDGMYYECTYNGDKGEMYLDAYKKFENRCIQV